DSIYGPFARARRDELRKSQIAVAAPQATQPQAAPASPRLTRGDVVKLFEPFDKSMGIVRASYVDPRDDRDLFAAAIGAMQRAFPPPLQTASAAQAGPGAPGSTGSDLNAVYDSALAIMNSRSSGNDDVAIAETAINGALAALDPHS